MVGHVALIVKHLGARNLISGVLPHQADAIGSAILRSAIINEL
jgi:hypothetical protein